MGKLGIALYPEKTTIEEDYRYIEKAASLGYKRIFTSLLQIKGQSDEQSIDRIKTTIQVAKKFAFEVIADVHPYAFSRLGIALDDLSFLNVLGVDGLRLDMGFTGQEEAQLTRNLNGISVELNMSQRTHYLQRIMDYHPNKEKLMGCFNFYPQKYTGLDTEYLLECANPFKKAGIRSAAFITSHHGIHSPWTIQEGVCTLEEHRTMTVADQVRHYKMLGCIDDIIFGNAFASDEELEEAAAAFEELYPTFSVIFNEETTVLEEQIICETIHNYRGDRSPYMIRSSMPRMQYKEASVTPHKFHSNIQYGDVLILNNDFGQYKGEVQIALLPRPADKRINIVGHIANDNLLKYLSVYEDFCLIKK